ncbi:Nuclear transport factor [Giardia duodenalis assemblage B]|uniref:Nuclear transport factor n=1 Tax=Giardia duodenalis assemblage B TaxID=1394984 RepID=A0A132NTY4_GIAIN|nr:Nuclear transport factor [Giardia intestinalis assemblage B]
MDIQSSFPSSKKSWRYGSTALLRRRSMTSEGLFAALWPTTCSSQVQLDPERRSQSSFPSPSRPLRGWTSWRCSWFQRPISSPRSIACFSASFTTCRLSRCSRRWTASARRFTRIRLSSDWTRVWWPS